ncbi:hypothetical protein [Stenotrophomonas sp. CFBP 13718]|uniref:hypothetical protein n=1 Tax=Stenotrophomonas sp. CFBP 13718 TaxID=2775304 RepID=UPI001780ECA9|nr:hypothetical protein [Stenotrophomonas sp. CFBP 13718]MBD8696070.1 hypothetical protein [Stenotrophomonas sp. CFBP 13718]
MSLSQRVGRVEVVFFGSLVTIGIVGLFSPLSYNALPAGPVLEGVLAICVALLFRLPKARITSYMALAASYVTISYVLMFLFRPSNPLDFIQAYKAFIYVVPLCFFYKRQVFSRSLALKVLKLLLIIFFLKYSYSLALDLNPRMGSRPGLFVENNFELIFLLIYFFVLFEDFGKYRNLWFGLLSVLILLSGSRSSALALIVVFCGLYLHQLSLKTFFYLLGLGLLALAAGALFLSRGYAAGGIESIDRFRFMMVFLYEIRNWSIFDFAFGSFPITPLSNESCRALSFYQGLFSYSEDGTCYSVVLHSYFFRVIFDHGLAGLVFLVSFIAFALHGSGYSRGKIIVVIGVLFASALSVSAMNSIFATLALALALGLTPHSEKFPASPLKYAERD